MITDLTAALRRRQRRADRSRADVERLLTREDTGIRERVLWRMLYETAARSAEVLRLDVEDLDLPNRKAKVAALGRRGRRDRVADRHGPAAAPPAEGPQVRPGAPHRPPVAHRAAARMGSAVCRSRGPQR
jgi:integrase